MRPALAVLSGFIAVITDSYAISTNTTELDAVEINESKPSKHRAPLAPALQLNDDALQKASSRSIGETLKDELGISNQSFGPGVGTPVIRGQAGPRVRVLSNGMGSGDVAAFSPDHAAGVETPMANEIEVFRGPASLLYGSGLLGGAVNVIDNRIPQVMPTPNTALAQRFDSAATETTTALKLDGARKQLAYHLDGFYRHRDNLSIAGAGIDTQKLAQTDPGLNVIDNPIGYLPNTQAEALSGAAGLSWIDTPGFAGASIQSLNNSYGIVPDGTGNETVQIAMRQQKVDVKGALNQPFRFADKLSSRFAYTDYQHSEIANGALGAVFSNKQYEGRVDINHKPIGPLQGQLGFQALASDFMAVNADATAIVPRSHSYQTAAFAFETLDVGAVRYQLGTRIEPTHIQPDGLTGFNYTPVNAAVAALWQLTAHHGLSLAMTRFARAPQVQELLSNGLHEATRTWDLGNPHLRQETGYNLDVGYRYQANGFRAEIDLFQQWADDYIFQRRTGEYLDEDGNSTCSTGCVPLQISSQAPALFKGYEAKLVLPLMENRHGLLDVTLFSDYTRGELINNGNVPRMPPLRYGLQWDYQQHAFNSWLRITRAEDQPYAGEYDSATPGYVLVNLGAQYTVKAFKNSNLVIFAKGNNLLNEQIRNAVSYLRNFAPEAGRGAEIGFRVSY